LRTHLADFLATYISARRLKTLNGLTPYEYICKIWTSEPERFILNPIHQMPGLNTWGFLDSRQSVGLAFNDCYVRIIMPGGFPAARVTDMHTCPMCLGAPFPIIPPCALTVLIGGLPAARMTDLCACVAPIPVPVDAIVFGSPTVVILGLPAARMLDLTAKGGAILPPCMPTVLIGLVGVPTISLPGMPGAPNLPALPDLPGAGPGPVPGPEPAKSPICATLGVAAKNIAKARDDGMLADAAYGNPDAVLPANTRKATVDDLKAIGFHDGVNDLTKIPDSNFRTEVFVQTDPVTKAESYVVGFKGSSFPPWKYPEDWVTNLKQGMGKETQYYNRAMLLAKRAQIAAPGKVRYVGHSLGGGMAAAAAAVSGAKATTFNSAGVNKATVERMGEKLEDAAVKAYAVSGEILSMVQDVLKLPPAIGERLPLKPRPSSSMMNNLATGAGAVFGGLVAGPLGAALGGIGAAALLEAGKGHMMSEMFGALEQEAARIADEQAKTGCT